MDNVEATITDERGRDWKLTIDPAEPEVVTVSPSWARIGITLNIATLNEKLFALQQLATIEYAEAFDGTEHK